ncbi:MAG: PAS domain S-box protein, partial [Methanomicrobiales archaeon]|nr:PAS domain S-box protein [Methanomicrobiales archaeon]
MKPIPGSFLKRIPFSYFLFLNTLLLTLILVTGITAVDFLNAEHNLQEGERAHRQQTEEDLNISVRLVDTGLKMFDDTLNRQMRQAFIPFMEEYERSGRDPANMNLTGVKGLIEEQVVSKLTAYIAAGEKNGEVNVSGQSGTMDLYIINETGVITHSTYPAEIGLDFKQMGPGVYDYLTNVRLSDGFFPERVVQEATTGKLRKYAYMPTPDHRYVLELGLTEEVFKKERSQLKYRDAIEQIRVNNPYLEGIRIFTTAKRQVGDRNFTPDANLSQILDTVLQERKTLELPEYQGRTIKYLFIDLVDPDYSADMSLILELTYNTSLITTALHHLVLFHMVVALIALGLSSVAGLILTRQLSRPIQSIVHDVDTIAKGNLEHTISPPIGKEFLVLEKSIATMVETLRRTIEQLQSSETNLRRSEERYRAVIESQNELISRFTADGIHIFMNDAYCRYFGMRCEELTGTKFIPNIPLEERELVKHHFSSLTQEHPTATIEHRIIMSDGSIRWQQWNDTAIFDTNEALIEYQSVGRDITERKRAEEELKKLYAELEERVVERTQELQNANRELESFSYSVSHDLRAPLRAIDGYSRILLEEHGERCTPEERRYLELVRKSAQRMADLIDALLEFSHLGREALKPQQVMPGEIIREVLDDLATE